MKPICVVLLSLISCSCEEIMRETGPPGGSVHIKCPYHGWYKGGHKYFCKAAKDGGCDILVSDEEHRQLTAQRLNLTYHKEDKYFMVTMTNLTGEDTGVYWCAAEKPPPSDRPDLLSEVYIHVNPVYGDEGDEATFRCPYAEGFQGNKKLFSSGECSSWNKDILIISEEGQTQAKTGRFSLYDNIDARVFSVTMRGLTAKDSGKYLCAVRTGLTDVCIMHELVVRDVMTGAYGGSVNITCKYQGSHKQPLYLCPAKSVGHCEMKDLLVTSLLPHQSRYFLNKDKHDGVFTVTITDLRSEDAGIYWCGESGAETKTEVRLKVTRAATKPTLTPNQMTSLPPVTGPWLYRSPIILTVSLTVVMVVMVVIIGAVVFMIYRNRRNNIPVPAVSLPQMTPRDPNTQNDVDYENDTARGAAVPTTTQQGPVYQSLNPDTTQQDPVYQSLNPDTTQQDPVYQSLNPNSIQQDPVYQSLNPNTTQQDPVYQSLNPNSIQQDPVYQSLNPNTIQQDTVYQSLNPNTTQQD